ncbi:hypothetical protein JCM8547_008089 [Rhodosporidiobolus lusitaniae]
MNIRPDAPSLYTLPTPAPPPRPRKQHPSHAMSFDELPVFPSSIPAPYAIAPSALPAYLQPRVPLAPTSANFLPPTYNSPSSSLPFPGLSSSAAKPSTATRPKKGVAKGKATVKADPDEDGEAGGTPGPSGGNGLLFLAPEYTLNPAGPASNSDTDFKCPQCDKVYRGKHARSIWRRHLQDKHDIPLSQQPRRTRWDNDANRPKSEEEKRARTLDSKRRWARKNRADKSGSAKPPSVKAEAAPSAAGSVGTPASDLDDGEGDESADADSSFDATSVAGWSTEGAAAMHGMRGGSAPLQQQQQQQQQGANPFYPYAAPPVSGRKAGSFAHLDPYSMPPAAPGRPQLRTANSMPPAPYAVQDDPRQPLYHPEPEYHHAPVPHHQPAYPHYSQSVSPGNASPFHPSAGPSNPYSHPFLPQSAVEQPHYALPQHLPPPPAQHVPHPTLYDTHDPPHYPSGNPLLAPPSSAAHHLRRPASTPNPALPSPFDHPQAGPSGAPPVLAGQPAPVAQSYYARSGRAGQSPARTIITSGLESPVKLRSKPSALGLGGALGPSSLAAPNGKGKEHPREDAAGILLALKAGPSSPMHAPHSHGGGHVREFSGGVQSPVSNLRDRDTGDEDDSRDELDHDEDAQVEARLMGVSLPPPTFGRVGVVPMAHQLSNGSAGGGVVPPPVVSPQKRRRSESPAPMQPTSSSSGGEGSTAAAHALLATAKKAHGYVGRGVRGGPAGASWSHASLVATPTPGGLMQSMIESSPAVGRGAAYGGAGGAGAESEGELQLVDEDEEELGGDGGAGRREDELFTSSSSGGRHRRGRSESPSRKSRRNGGRGGMAGSSSSAASGSSSQPRHHHYPVGLTSELGEFGLHSAERVEHQHHHHDPLRETAGSMLPPASSSSTGSYPPQHLTTPASSSSVALPPSSASAPRSSVPAPSHPAHHHDPFLSQPAPSMLDTLSSVGGHSGAAGIPPSTSAHLIRTSSPPFASYSNFLFSSPAHPQFSKTLGLTAAPGPGVLSYNETPGGGKGGPPAAPGERVPRERETSTGSVGTLDGLLELKTPARGRLMSGVSGVDETPGRDSGIEDAGLEEDTYEEDNGTLEGTPEEEDGRLSGSGGDEEEDEEELE